MPDAVHVRQGPRLLFDKVEQMADDIQKDLDESNSIAEAQMLRPNAEEVSAIKQQCNLVLEKRTLESQSKDDCKPLREKVTEAKKSLLESMKTFEDKTITYSKEKLKELEQVCAAEGLPAVPPYIRVIVSTKDSPIKAAIFEEALASISPEDIEEQKQKDREEGVSRSFREILQDTILLKIRHNVRNVSEQIKLSNSLERGRKYHEIAEHDSLADMALQWHLNEQRMKRQRELARENVGEIVTAIKSKESLVEQFFVRTQTSSQKLVLQDKSQRLVHRASSRKSRVGFTMVSPWVTEVLDTLEISSFKSFLKKQTDVLRELQERIEKLPIETKMSVSLVACKGPDDS